MIKTDEETNNTIKMVTASRSDKKADDENNRNKTSACVAQFECAMCSPLRQSCFVYGRLAIEERSPAVAVLQRDASN